MSTEMRKNLKIISSSSFWDETYYKTRYGNSIGKKNPAVHYLTEGWKLGYNPSALFSNDAYMTFHADVRTSAMNPLIHYEQFGRFEKREISSVALAEQNQVKNIHVEEIRKMHLHGKIVLLISHEMSLTGAPRAILNMGITLKKIGYQPVFFSLKDGPLTKEIATNGFPYYIESYFYTKIKQKNSILNTFLSEFNIVVFNTLDTVPLVEYFTRKDIRKICWLHEGRYSYAHYKKEFDLSTLFASFDKIYAVGEYSKSFAAQYVKAPDKLDILLYGIPEEEHTNDNKVKFLLPGVICKRKGQDILIESLKYLPENILNQVSINIVGSIADERIKEQIIETQNINYLGEMPHNELMSILSHSDVLLCPSLDDPMPIVCTEAMMYSKPVIVSLNTGTASYIQNGINGYTIPAGDSKALAKVLELTVKGRNTLPEMGEKARLIYEQNFTMRYFQNNIKKIMEDI